MDIWRTLEVLFKRKWLILGGGLIALLLTYAATRDMKSIWSAKVTLMAPPPAVNPSALGKAGENAVADPGDPETRGDLYDALLKSSRVLEPALKEAGVSPDIESLLDNISIEGGKAGLYILEVRGSEPATVEKLANALGSSLQNRGVSFFTDRVDNAVHLLESELRAANQELLDLRNRYEAQRRRYGVVERLEDHLGPALGRLESARAAQEEAKVTLSELKARIHEKRRLLERLPGTLPAPPAEPSPLVRKLEEELADAERQLTLLQARYTDEVAAVKIGRATRDALQERLERERSAGDSARVMSNPVREKAVEELAMLMEELAGNQALLAQQQANLTSARAAVAGYAGADGPLSALTDELARRGETRASLEARLRIAQISRDALTRQSPLTVLERVNRFNPAVNLTAGKRMRLILVTVLASLVLAAGAAIALDALDRRLRTLPQAELLLPGPVLAAVPQAAGPVRTEHLGAVARSFPLSPHAEAYHFLASHLDSERGAGCMVLMVTASRSGVGSARTAANVAISLAQAGRRVVLADFNLRRPVLHELLELQNGSGVSELLYSTGLEDLQLFLQPGPQPGLSVLTAGSHAGSPWELLHSGALPGLFRSLRAEADFIIVDTPCALAFSDAQELAPQVDAALLCIRAQEMATGSEDRLVQSLERQGSRFLGTALYDVPVAALESYRSHLYCLEPQTRRAPTRVR